MIWETHPGWLKTPPNKKKKQKNLIFLHDHQVFEISFFFKKKERTYEAGGMGDVD